MTEVGVRYLNHEHSPPVENSHKHKTFRHCVPSTDRGRYSGFRSQPSDSRRGHRWFGCWPGVLGNVGRYATQNADENGGPSCIVYWLSRDRGYFDPVWHHWLVAIATRSKTIRSLRSFALAVLVLLPVRFSFGQAIHREALMPPRTAKVMGTLVMITLWGHDRRAARSATASVFAEFERIEQLMGTWHQDSAVSRINTAAGKRAVSIDAETFHVLQSATKIANKTQGAFDITVGGFRGLWKFDQDRDGSIPPTVRVIDRLKLVNYRFLLLQPTANTAKLQKRGARITLGGIAKGYAVDRAVEILRKRGFRSFLLQAGGDLYASGRKGSVPWRVGIRDPRGPPDSYFAATQLEDRTFSTSGDYERAVVKAGIRYHHILDPHTGYPATKSRSVTVMAKSAMIADAYSTALFVLGAQKGLALVERLPEIEAIFVDDNNKVHVSAGLKQKIHIFRPPTPGI